MEAKIIDVKDDNVEVKSKGSDKELIPIVNIDYAKLIIKFNQIWEVKLINRALIDVFSEIAREKNVERSELGSIIEQLFLHLIERDRGDSSNCSVIVNLDKGELEIYAERQIVDDLMDPVLEITLQDAAKLAPGENFEVGDVFVEVIDPAIFGRRLVTSAKQFFNQRLNCLLYTSPSPRDLSTSRMPSSA